MENHEATQHEFTRRCLRYFYDEADLDEREQLEDDLPVFAEGVYHFGGYDLDQRLAGLAADNAKLRAACESALDWLDRFSIHSPIAFGGEAELASQLSEALARRALGEPPTT